MSPIDRMLGNDELEDPPPDFVTHLERRLGTSREVALKLLHDWVSNYEPVTRRSIHMQHGFEDAARATAGERAA